MHKFVVDLATDHHQVAVPMPMSSSSPSSSVAATFGQFCGNLPPPPPSFGLLHPFGDSAIIECEPDLQHLQHHQATFLPIEFCGIPPPPQHQQLFLQQAPFLPDSIQGQFDHHTPVAGSASSLLFGEDPNSSLLLFPPPCSSAADASASFILDNHPPPPHHFLPHHSSSAAQLPSLAMMTDGNPSSSASASAPLMYISKNGNNTGDESHVDELQPPPPPMVLIPAMTEEQKQEPHPHDQNKSTPQQPKRGQQAPTRGTMRRRVGGGAQRRARNGGGGGGGPGSDQKPPSNNGVPDPAHAHQIVLKCVADPPKHSVAPHPQASSASPLDAKFAESTAEMVAKRCAHCSEDIRERTMLAVGGGDAAGGGLLATIEFFHCECLKCSECADPLEHTPKCYVRASRVFCAACYARNFGVSCAMCERRIAPTDWVRRAREFVYHLACFKCEHCKRQLSTGEQFSLDDEHRPPPAIPRLLCKQHYLELVRGEQCSPKQKAKRVRTTFGEEQLAILQEHFKVDSNPDGADLERIANLTGLSKRVTQVWFQNSRARQKKYHGHGPCRKLPGGGNSGGSASGSVEPFCLGECRSATLSPSSCSNGGCGGAQSPLNFGGGGGRGGSTGSELSSDTSGMGLMSRHGTIMPMLGGGGEASSP